MTSLHASPDRRFADAVHLETADVESSAVTSPADRRTFRASSLQEAIDIATIELGGDVTVLEANRIRRGGLGGFFATDLGVEVIVTRDASASRSRRTGADDTGAVSAVDRLLGRFGEREGDRFTPSTGVEAMGERSATERAVARGRRLGVQAVGDDGFDMAPTTSMDRRSFVFDDDVVFEFDDAADPVVQTVLDAPPTDAGTDAPMVFDVDDVAIADTDDSVEPVAPARHPFADLLEQELRSMTVDPARPVETAELAGPADPADVAEVAGVAPRLGSETDLVMPPIDSPAPIVEPVSIIEPRPSELVPIESTGDDGVFDPEERSAEDALADLDALLASAGIDLSATGDEVPSEPLDDDPTPNLAERPVETLANVSSTDVLLDLTDRLADQLSSVDRFASGGEGLRRMQVKISAPDGSLVEMQAEWGERG